LRPDPWNRPANYEEEKWWWIFKNPVGFVILATFIIGVVIIVWHMVKPFPKNSDGIPMITASKNPLKLKPENPGGDITPHQDKMVYQNLVRKDGPKNIQVERIILPPSVGAMLDSNIENTKAAQEEMSEQIDRAIESLPKKEVVTAPTILEKTKAKGKFKIQLGSLKSPTKAKEEWERVHKAHKDLLGDFSPIYSTVDLGEKGHYTRLRIEGFETKDKAKHMCEQLKAKKVGCMVVK
jgi:cell division protein FtsN